MKETLEELLKKLSEAQLQAAEANKELQLSILEQNRDLAIKELEKKKTWRELVVPMENDIYYPILYLLYKKDILSEAELINWIETRSYLQSFHDVLDSVDNMVNTTEVQR